jgi:hypothetical protein
MVREQINRKTLPGAALPSRDGQVVTLRKAQMMACQHPVMSRDDDPKRPCLRIVYTMMKQLIVGA